MAGPLAEREGTCCVRRAGPERAGQAPSRWWGPAGSGAARVQVGALAFHRG